MSIRTRASLGQMKGTGQVIRRDGTKEDFEFKVTNKIDLKTKEKTSIDKEDTDNGRNTSN